MSFIYDVIKCFIARGMPQNNHYYNKKEKNSNGKPELGVLFEQPLPPPPPPPPHTHTHTHTD